MIPPKVVRMRVSSPSHHRKMTPVAPADMALVDWICHCMRIVGDSWCSVGDDRNRIGGSGRVVCRWRVVDGGNIERRSGRWRGI